MAKLPSKIESMMERARHLGLHGLLAHWNEIADEVWLPRLIEYEETERHQRSLQRRIQKARLLRFKPMAEFNWKWPTKIDREAIEELFTFDFLSGELPVNVVILGANGLGKSMICQNLAHQALLRGDTVLFTTASDMLNDLAAQKSDTSLRSRLRRYTQPQLLVVDEVGYLSYDARYADLFFEIITRRYEKNPIILSTNKAFSDWTQVFPNATCVVTLIDRLVHRAEIITIEGESYRLKEAKERAAEKIKKRTKSKSGASRPSSTEPFQLSP